LLILLTIFSLVAAMFGSLFLVFYNIFRWLFRKCISPIWRGGVRCYGVCRIKLCCRIDEEKRRKALFEEMSASNTAKAKLSIFPSNVKNDGMEITSQITERAESSMRIDEENARRKCELVLTVESTDMSPKQRQNLCAVLSAAEKEINSSGRNGQRRRKRNFLDQTVERIVAQICDEGNQRMVLARNELRKCRAFKDAARRVVEREKGSGRIGIIRNSFPLPVFEIMVMPIQQSLKYNLGQARKEGDVYEEKQSALGTRQTRHRYLFQHTPVLQSIVGDRVQSQR